MSLSNHRGSKRRGSGPRDHADRAELVLDPEQQDQLRAHGFGPDAPAHDFEDPAVRDDLVRALIACGALRPATNLPLPLPRKTRRAG